MKPAATHELAPEPVQQPGHAPEIEAEEPPPFLGTWRNVYVFVLGELVVTVLAFYALTRWFS